MTKRMAMIAAMIAAGTAMPALAQMGPGSGGPMGMFAQADTNGDGVISKAEYVAARSARFAQMDSNGDGVLSMDDAKGDERGGRRMERMIAEADFDKDGKVTKDELDKAPTPMFDRLDTNGDGVVDKAEMAKAMEAMQQMREQRGN